MSFSTLTHQKRSELVFIDVDQKPVTESTQPATDVKEERPPTPEEKQKATEEEKLQCAECTFTTVSADRMTRHMRKHRGENPFQCNWCDYSTYNSVMFEEHVNIHKGIKPYQCKLCEYRSVSRKYIKKHESRHVTCDKCGFAARDIRLMRRHVRHSAACRADDEPPEGRFRCANCNKSYESAECLRAHIRQHQLCADCGEGFSGQELLKHRHKVHGVEKESVPKKSKFKCAVCEFESNWHQKILLHLIHHPAQQLDPALDVTPLVRAGIL